jgi:hypothetical protein
MRRVVRYDGLLPAVIGEDGNIHGPRAPDEIREMKAFIDAHRPQEMPFDIVAEGETPIDNPKEATAAIRSWEDAGATWWIEAMARPV